MDKILDLLCARAFLNSETKIKELSNDIRYGTLAINGELESYALVYQKKSEDLLRAKLELEDQIKALKDRIEGQSRGLKVTEEQKALAQGELDKCQQEMINVEKKVIINIQVFIQVTGGKALSKMSLS